LIDRLTANESEKSMEDDLLEEPDVSLGEESQETEQPAEAETEEKPAETPAPADNGVSEADEMEKKKLERAKKFGIEAPEVVNDKKKSRAERFGLTQPSVEKDEMEAKKKSRAERFGLNINQKRKAKLEGMDIGVDAEKLKKRQERFGSAAVQAAKAGSGEIDEKKAARAARFAQKV